MLKGKLTPRLLRKIIRESRFETPAAVARRCGLSARTISRFLAGRTIELMPGTRHALAAAFPSYREAFGIDRARVMYSRRSMPPIEVLSPKLVRRLIAESRWETPNAFAIHWGIAVSALARYLRGESSTIGLSTRCRLAAAFPAYLETFGRDATCLGSFADEIARVVPSHLRGSR